MEDVTNGIDIIGLKFGGMVIKLISPATRVGPYTIWMMYGPNGAFVDGELHNGVHTVKHFRPKGL